MNAGHRLKKLRESLRLKQKDMAALLSMQPTSYNHIERGHNNISPRVAMLLKLRFGVNEDWLKEGQGEMHDPSTKPYQYYPILEQHQMVCEDVHTEQLSSDNIDGLKKQNSALLRDVADLKKELALFKHIVERLINDHTSLKD